MNKIKFENEFKGFLKRKVKVTTALIVTFLISGSLAMPQTTEQQLQELKSKIATLEAKVLGSNIIFGDKAKDEDAAGKKNSVILGEEALNKGQRSIVIGVKAKNTMIENGKQSSGKELVENIVIGNNAIIEATKGTGIAQKSVAIGSGSKVSDAMRALALGENATVKKGGDNGVAIGQQATVESFAGFAMGRQALVEANSKGAIAIGNNDTGYNKGNGKNGGTYQKTTAKGAAATAIGSHATAMNEAATAIGARAFATEKETAAIGANAKAEVVGGVAIGSFSVANRKTTGSFYDFTKDKVDETNKNTYANTFSNSTGTLNNDTKKDSVKLATKSAFSIGNTANGYTRQLIGLAAGTEDSDAVNVWQLKQAKQSTVDKGLNFEVSYADTSVTEQDANNKKQVHKKLGETLSLLTEDKKITKDNAEYTGKNLLTYVKEETVGKDKVKKVYFGLKDKPTFNEITSENKITIGSSNGVELIKDAANNLKLNNKKITGLAKATEDTDAVRYDQVSSPFKVEADNKNNVTMNLGDTFKITGRKIDGTRDFDTWSVTNSNTKKGTYSTENIETFVDRQGTRTSVLVGIKENPTFKTLILKDGNKTVTLTPTADGLSLGNKKITDITSISGGKGDAPDDTTDKSKIEFTKDGLKLSHDNAELKITKDGDKVKLEGIKENTVDEDYGKTDGVVATQKEVKTAKDAATEKVVDETPNAGEKKLIEVTEANGENGKGKTYTVKATQDLKDKIKEIDNKVNKDASNLDENGANTNRDKWISKLGTDDGTIKPNDQLTTENNGKGRLITEQAFNNYMDNNKLKFGADSGDEIERKLGEKLDIKAGDITNNRTEYKAKNIYTKTDKTKNQISIGIKENPEFKYITLVDNGNTVNLTATADGLNLGDKKITGIKDGTISSTSNEAVTGKQLDGFVKEIAPANGETDIEVTKDTNKPADGGQKYTVKLSQEFKNKVNGKADATELEKYAKKDGSNLTGLKPEEKKAWADGIGTTTISETDDMANNGSDNHLVTAGAVKNFVNGKGLTFKSDFGNGFTKTLGSTVEILGGTSTGNENKEWKYQKDQTQAEGIDYSTENVMTKEIDDKIFIGLKKAPKFDSLQIKDKSSITQTDSSLDLTYDGAKLSITKDNDKVKLLGLKDNDINSTDYGTENSGTAATQKELKDLLGKLKDNKTETKDNQTIVFTDDQGNKLVRKDNKFYKMKADGSPDTATEVEKEKVMLKAVDTEGNVQKPMTLANIKNTLGNNNYGVSNLLTEADNNKLSRAASMKDIQEVAKAGLTFGATFGPTKTEANGNTFKKQLGETVTITASGTDIGKYEGAENNYSGSNLATYVKDDNGEKKIFIGMKENSRFKSLTIGGSEFGKEQKDGKGKISATDDALELGHGDAKISITKAGDTNGDNKKAKITGLKDNDINSEDYGKPDSGIAATQKEVKDALNQTKKVQDGSAGTVVYTKKDGTRLVKEVVGGVTKWYEADDNGSKKNPASEFTPTTENDVILSVVNKDGKTTEVAQLGNLKSALGLTKDKNGLDGGTKTNILTKLTATTGNNMFSDNELNSAATLRDIQFLARTGLNFKANHGTVTKALGDTVSIVGGATLEEKMTTQTGTNGDPDTQVSDNGAADFEKRFNAENVVTYVEPDKTIKIGIAKNLKKINSVESDGDNNNKVKMTLEKDKGAKFTTGNNGATTTIGKDGIDISKNGETDPSVSIKAGKDGNGPSIDFKTTDGANGKEGTGSISGLKDLQDTDDGHRAANKNYVDKKTKAVEEKVNNIKFTFKGNSGEIKDKSNGEITIKGTGTNADNSTNFNNNYSSENIATKVEGDNIVIGVAKEMKNMTSFETKEEDGKKSKLDNAGLTTENGNSKSSVGADKITIGDKATGTQDKPKQEVEISKNKIEFKKDKDGNGSQPTLTIDGDKQQIKGLADLKDGDDGSLAANKNYVDSKLKDLKDGNPFEYFKKPEADKVIFGEDGKVYEKSELEGKKYDPKTKQWTKEDGSNLDTQPKAYEHTKLIRGKDNKFYTEEELKDKKWDDAKKQYQSDNGTVANPYDGEVTIKAMPQEKPLTLGNIADGRIEKNSTDAINGGQLFDALDKKLDKDGKNIDKESFAEHASAGANIAEPGEKGILVTDKQVSEHLKGNYYNKTEINNKFDGIAKDIQAVDEKANQALGGNALAAALAALNPMYYDPLRPSQFMVGVGGYKDHRAFAVGIAHYLSESTMVTGGVSVGNNAGIMLNAGLTHKFGEREEIEKLPEQYQAGPMSSVYAMQNEVQQLLKENSNQQDTIKNLESELQQVRAEKEKTEQRLDDLEALVKTLLKKQK